MFLISAGRLFHSFRRYFVGARFVVTPLSHTCNDVLLSEIHSPPRIGFSFGMCASFVPIENRIVFIHSSAAEAIVISA